jgi:hypothetical protein
MTVVPLVAVNLPNWEGRVTPRVKVVTARLLHSPSQLGGLFLRACKGIAYMMAEYVLLWL